MQQSGEARPGRKRVSSRAVLEEAACELFVEQTYGGTTIEQITYRAGVSRNTFFNYFAAKSDVLWASVDDALDALSDDLNADQCDVPVVVALRDTLIAAAARFGPGQLPLAATQYEVMGAVDELKASGLTRFLRMAAEVEHFLTSRRGFDDRGRSKVVAFAFVGAIAAATTTWTQAGTARHPLNEYVAEAISPLCDGFDSAFSTDSVYDR